MPFSIGAQVQCSDAPCGHLDRVVIDPLARSVTHLVVEPSHWQAQGRLVPVGLARSAAGVIRLQCTRAEFDQLEPADTTQFLTGAGGAGYPSSAVLAWPYFGLAGPGMAGGPAAAMPMPVTVDAVPPGEVQVRRGRPVHATDGHIGHVEGLVVDPRSHRMTHVLLREGHLRGRKDVAIPVSAVTAVDADGIRLRLSKQEVAALPPVDISHPA